MYNTKLRSRKNRRNVAVLHFDDIDSDNEWITEDVEEENVTQSHGDDDIVVDNQVNPEPTLVNEEDPEHLILNPILEEPLSSGEEFDDDGDEDHVDGCEDVGGFGL